MKTMTAALMCFTAIALAYCSRDAHSQVASACGKGSEVARTLAEKYGEVLVAEAPTTAGTTLRVFVSGGEQNTWSIAVTMPGEPDFVCMVAAGKNWKARPHCEGTCL